MFGLKRNAATGLNLSCGAKLQGGSGDDNKDDASPSRNRLLKEEKEALARREAAGGEAIPPATLAPDAGRVALPIAAYITSTPVSLPQAMEAAAAGSILSLEEELDGHEPEPLEKRPAVLPLLELVGEAGHGPGAGASPPQEEEDEDEDQEEEEEDDELFLQSLEIISRYLREQATSAKDPKPMGGSAASSQKALETLRRVGKGVQRNHEMAFQGMLRKLDIKNEDDVKSLSREMVDVFSDGVTNWGRIVTLISFGAFVAKHLKSINQENCIDPLAESITDVLVRTKRDWLVKHRGWDGFVEFFHVEDLEGGIRNVLLAFAGIAVVGAGLAYLIR